MNVDGVEFVFPPDWQVVQYDQSRFYKNQFQHVAHGQKGVDILAMDGRRTLWCIEVKDYRTNRRTKAIDLALEVALKARDTLAGILAARCNAVDDEQGMAALFTKAQKIRVALQLEQPRIHSKLFPRSISPISIEQKLKKLIKPIDPHPVVTESARRKTGIEWAIERR